ncbi:protein TALPID3-like, partial [Seriola lalandi dorsalis]|uniref:protein TALPID3-like n=1 Tax=Seriola lalandi dorsalis TaxID=1841481 RepID=UPI000C6F5972
MFRQPASSSHTPRDLSGDLSPDQSSCSSDTGDVLIRSTRVLVPDRRHETGPGPGSVQITVQKLRDHARVQPPLAEQRQRPKPRQKPNTGATPRSATDGQPDRRTMKEPARTKENREPTGTAQSDMEARVCQLADGVQRLLQADREAGDRGRSLSQQTLQHLETLHSQQLQLQSQLLESALKIVTGHAPVTSVTSELTALGQPTHLQVTHLDTA